MTSKSSATFPNMTLKDIYDNITGDFESLWNTLSSDKASKYRGNFTFALLDMILLEVISRVCKLDKSGNLLREFADCLYCSDKRYFGVINGWSGLKQNSDYTIPYKSQEGKEVLSFLFDLIRNGQAHQYQQIVVKLKDCSIVVTIYGAIFGVNLKTVNNRSKHLDVKFANNGENNLVLIDFRPEIFYLDLTKAVTCSKIFDKIKQFNYLSRSYPAITKDFFLDSIGFTEQLTKTLQGKP